MTRYGKVRLIHALFALMALVAASGCGDDGPDDSSHGSGHGSIEGLELRVADTGTLLAEWSPDDGWRDAEGEAIDTLPDSVVSGEELEPLRAGGAPASLEVRLVGEGEVDITPRAGIDSAEDNPCGEYSVRYFPLDDATSVIAWPNLPHPDLEDGPSLFAERGDGELVQIFHCDRLDIYPEEAGREDLELLLWHLNHADEAVDAIAVEVLEE